MAERQTKQRQDEAGTNKSFPKLSTRETEERTVITITTDSQTTDGEEKTQDEENDTAADKVTKTVEDTEIHASPPTATANWTLTTDTPMPTSLIGCSTAISARTNSRDPTATPTRPSDATTEPPERSKVHGMWGGLMESKEV